MIYRRFGKTELQIPVFSFGGMRFDEHKDEQTLLKNVDRMVHKAIDVGITHIETARGYKNSEERLGKVLSTIPRDKFILQTKTPLSDSAETFEQSLELSFKTLGVEYVDLLAMHGMLNSEEQAIKGIEVCLPVLKKWQKAGRIGFIGASGHAWGGVLERIVKSADLDYINIHYFYILQVNKKAIEIAKQKDMGVFIISPNDKGGRLYRPDPKLSELTAPLTPMQFNDLFTLSNPGVHTLSMGAAKPSDFDEHLDILDKLNDINHISQITQRLEAAIEDMFGTGWNNHYWESIPPFYEIKNEANIQAVLWLYTIAKGIHIKEFAKWRYDMLGEAGGVWFPGTKVFDNLTEAEIKEAVKSSPFADKIPEILTEAHHYFSQMDKVE